MASPEPTYITEAIDRWQDRAVVSRAAMEAAVSHDDALAVALRGQLLIDTMLTDLILRLAPDADRGEIARMPFSLKVELVTASRVAMLDSDYKRCLNYINKIRNYFAHRLDFEWSDTEAERLRSSLPSIVLERLNTNFPSASSLLVLKETVRTIWAIIAYATNHHDVMRVDEAARMARLSDALDRLDESTQDPIREPLKELSNEEQFRAAWHRLIGDDAVGNRNAPDHDDTTNDHQPRRGAGL